MDWDIRVIRSRDEFAAAAGAWNDLVGRATLRNSFHRHEWYLSWLENLAPDCELCVVTLAREGRLAAAAPLQLVTRRKRGLALRVLEFLQSGITPRSGLLVQDDALCAPLLRAIDGLGGWHVAELKAMELEHATTRALAAELRRRGPAVAEAGMVSPYEELPDSWDEYYQARTNKIRQRFRSAVNRTHQHEKVEILRLETYADLEPYFGELVAVSEKSWKSDEGMDMGTVGQVASFYQDYSRRTDGQQAWIVYLLRLDDKPAAFMYLLRDGSHWVALRSDYDEDYSYHMPGVYVHKEVISDLAQLPPPRVYDLVGWATAFKSSLAREGRPLCDLTFGSRSVPGRVLMAGKTLLGRRADAQHLDLDRVVAGTVPRAASGEGD